MKNEIPLSPLLHQSQENHKEKKNHMISKILKYAQKASDFYFPIAKMS